MILWNFAAIIAAKGRKSGLGLDFIVNKDVLCTPAACGRWLKYSFLLYFNFVDYIIPNSPQKGKTASDGLFEGLVL